MACQNLACLDENGCVSNFEDGANGQVLIVNAAGEADWGGPVDIAIADVGGYYTADNLESALQQVGNSLSTHTHALSCPAVLACLATATQAASDCTFPARVISPDGLSYSTDALRSAQQLRFFDYVQNVAAGLSNVGVTAQTVYSTTNVIVTNGSSCLGMEGFIIINPSGALMVGTPGTNAAVTAFVDLGDGAGFIPMAEHRVRINGGGARMEEFINYTPLPVFIPVSGFRNIRLQMRYEVLAGTVDLITLKQFSGMVMVQRH